jgi:TolB-like protein
VFEAVICATEFQNTIKERNNSVGEEEQMEFRVGVNMGDVVIEGDNLYGDGVNVAARLEALAQPGGICLSKNVHEIVNKKTDFQFNDLGEQKVKDTLLHAVDVVIDASHERKIKTKSKSQVPLIAAIVGILVLGIGGFAYYNFSIKDTDQKNGKTVETSSDRPAILVMPFANQSGKKENDYIGNGMTSHLITTLSQHEQLLVLGKSTGEYVQKNQIPDEEIKNKYGAQFVLGGGIQVSGNKSRINVELKDLAKNDIIGSEIYDFSEDDIFNIQDQVGSSVLSHLQIEITMGGFESTALKRHYTPEVYKNRLLQGTAFQLMTPEGHYGAEELWEINKKLEPDNFYLDVNRAWQLVQKTWLGISKKPQEDLKKARRLALGVLEKDPDYVAAMSIAAMIEQTLGDFDAACGRIDKMSILSEEVVDIAMVADTQRSCGDYDGSIITYEKVHRIAPHYSAWVKVYYLFAIMMKTFEEKSGDYEKAKNYALEHSNKDYIMAGASETFHTVLAYIYHKEGDVKLAKDHFEKQKTMKNSITKWWIENYDFVNSRPKEFMNDYVKVLQSLGMPDQ